MDELTEIVDSFDAEGLTLEEGFRYWAAGSSLWVQVNPSVTHGHWHIGVIRLIGCELTWTKHSIASEFVIEYLAVSLVYENIGPWHRRRSVPTELNPIETEYRSSVGNTKFPGFVYFIHEPTAGLIKIGYSRDPQQRLKAMQAHSPVPLTLIGMFEGNPGRERETHEKFSHCRRHGEWFEPQSDIVDYMNWQLEKYRIRSAVCTGR